MNSFDVSKAFMGEVKAARERDGALPGIPYGFPSLDKMTGGIRPGLVVLGAETGAGKSLIAGQWMLNAARHLQETQQDRVIRVVHCEMALTEIQTRLVSQMTEIPSWKIRHGKALTTDEYKRVHDAALDLAELPIEYLESPSSIEETMSFITQDNRCAWWIVDHAQAHDIGRGDLSPLDYRGLGVLAKEFALLAKKTPGLVLSQLTNDVGKREDKRPHKGDLFGGKMLQAPASLILLLYRPDVYQLVSEDKKYDSRTCYLIIDKNRYSGEVGSVKLVWNPVRGMFYDMSQVEAGKEAA